MPNRVGSSLIPLRAGRRLLRRENVDEAGRKIVEFVTGLDVPMQRHAVELRKHIDRAQAGVQAIADWNIDDPIFSTERHGRFGAILRQRKQPRAGATAHDDCKRSLKCARRQCPTDFRSRTSRNQIALRRGFHCVQSSPNAFRVNEATNLASVDARHYTRNMCGIVGYVGRAKATPILLDGLRRLEYRGYDSAGLAIVEKGHLETRKCAGRIGDTNVRSETDTEVLAHLIGKIYNDSCASTVDAPGKKARLFDAVRTALRQVIGTYGIALVHADVPDFMIGARRGSPLVLGVGNGENFLASDVSAIVAYTRDAVYLNDFDVVAAGPEKFEITSLAGDSTEHPVSKVEFTAEDIGKGDYPHYMLKEIFEQPNTVRDAMRGRLNAEECTARLGGLNMGPPELRDVGRIVLTGCGTALHAGRVGEYLIERVANIPTEVDYASEFRHRNTPMTPETLVFAISQSGETADTLGALRESRRKGFRTLGICNNVASTIARESKGCLYTHVCPWR